MQITVFCDINYSSILKTFLRNVGTHIAKDITSHNQNGTILSAATRTANFTCKNISVPQLQPIS